MPDFVARGRAVERTLTVVCMVEQPATAKTVASVKSGLDFVGLVEFAVVMLASLSDSDVSC